LTFDAAI